MRPLPDFSIPGSGSPTTWHEIYRGKTTVEIATDLASWPPDQLKAAHKQWKLWCPCTVEDMANMMRTILV